MKLSKFERSQKAHTRLFDKYIVRFGSFDSNIKADYHSTVLVLQRQSKRVLSRRDKSIIYSHCYEKVMGNNPSGSTYTRKDYLDVLRRYDKK